MSIRVVGINLTKRAAFFFAAFLILWSISLGMLTAIFSDAFKQTAHADPVSFNFAAVGDHGAGSRAAAVFQKIAPNNIDFFTSLGDLSYGDATEANWCQFVKNNINIGAGLSTGNSYGENFPFQIISGGHENGVDNVGDGLIDEFVKPSCLPNRMSNAVMSPNTGSNPSASGNYAKEYYFDYPASAPIARFIMTSPQQNYLNGGLYDYTKNSARYNWVSSAIDDARANGIKWVIAGNHENYISAGLKSNEIGPDLFNLFVSKKVDLILQGHDHNYQRSHQLGLNANCTAISSSTDPTKVNSNCVVDNGADALYPAGGGSVLIINGTGGVGSYATSSTDVHMPYFAKISGNTTDQRPYGFTKFTVTDTGITGELIKAVDGQAFSDKFTIGTTSGDSTQPTAPTNVTATAVSSTQVNVSWTASTDNVGVAGYRVYRDGSQLAANVTGTTYTDSTVVAGTTYSYTVKAFDTSQNESPASAAATVTTPGAPNTLTFSSAADVSIQATNPTANISGATAVTMKADGDPLEHFLMKFNVTGVGSQQVTNARLRLYNTNASSKGGDFYPVADNSWTETGVTWNNAPAAGTTAIASLGTVAVNTYVDVNLTPYITGDGTFSLRTSIPNTDGVEYATKEASASGTRPQLILTLASNADTQNPTNPTNLTATATSQTQVDLSWTASTDNVGVTGYDIYRGGVLIASVTGTTYSNTGLTASTQYSYVVKAKDAAGNSSGNSNTATVTTLAPASTITLSPTADATIQQSLPTTNDGSGTTLKGDTSPLEEALLKFTVSGVGSQTVTDAKLRLYMTNYSTAASSLYTTSDTSWGESTVTWDTAPAAGSTAIGSIDTATPASRWVEVAVTSTVSADGTYSFRIKPNSSDKSEFASREFATTTQRPQLVLTLANQVDTTSPTAPTNVSATAASPTSVIVSWTASTDNVGVTGYRVYRDGNQIATGITGTAYTDATAAASTTYSYTVKAYDAAQNFSSESTAASVTTPAATNTLTFETAADVSIQSGNPTTNINGATNTSVKADNDPLENFLMKFDVTGVGTQTVTNAKLRLYSTNGSTNAGAFYPVTDNTWTETGVTWNNAPTAGTTAIATLGNVTTSTFVDVDLTSYITGDGTFSLRSSTPSSDGIEWATKEYTTNTARRPQLILTVQPSTPPPDTQSPTAPTSVTATATSPSKVDISWNASTDNVGVTGYKIFRNGTQLVTDLTTLTYTDTTASPSTTYSYVVQAYDAAGNTSASSNSSTVTTPAPVVLTFNPTADATIQQSLPTTNDGSATTLKGDTSPVEEALLKFTVSGIDNMTVTNAKIRLYLTNYSTAASSLYSTTDTSWSESTVTWDTAPAAGSTAIGTVDTATPASRWVEVAVTTVVNADGTYSFRLKPGSSDKSEFASREYATSTLRPELVVTAQ